ncbi:MAG: hypothetical protein IV107_25330 [Paucibacter sp.]|nr:hypothetical protein [Roseateles sp.]
MSSLSTVMAAAGLLICVFLAIRMALPARWRQHLDARLRRSSWALRDAGTRVRLWWRSRRFKSTAATEAEAAIRRAQAAAKPEGEWDGNVYRPKRFGANNKKPRDLH